MNQGTPSQHCPHFIFSLYYYFPLFFFLFYGISFDGERQDVRLVIIGQESLCKKIRRGKKWAEKLNDKLYATGELDRARQRGGEKEEELFIGRPNASVCCVRVSLRWQQIRANSAYLLVTSEMDLLVLYTFSFGFFVF